YRKCSVMHWGVMRLATTPRPFLPAKARRSSRRNMSSVAGTQAAHNSGQTNCAQKSLRPFAGRNKIRGGTLIRNRPFFSDEPALLHSCFHERTEQRMGVKGLRFQFRVVLHGDEPRVIRDFDNLRQKPVR